MEWQSWRISSLKVIHNTISIIFSWNQQMAFPSTLHFQYKATRTSNVSRTAPAQTHGSTQFPGNSPVMPSITPSHHPSSFFFRTYITELSWKLSSSSLSAQQSQIATTRMKQRIYIYRWLSEANIHADSALKINTTLFKQYIQQQFVPTSVLNKQRIFSNSHTTKNTLLRDNQK